MPVSDGCCPRCNDAIQPKHPEGQRSRKVDDVLFCVFCADYLEDRPAVREKYVEKAKKAASEFGTCSWCGKKDAVLAGGLCGECFVEHGNTAMEDFA